MNVEADKVDRDAIAAFRDSLVDDVYAAQDFIPWEDIENDVERARPGVDRLNELARASPDGIDPEALADALLNEPTVLSVIQRLLAAPGGGVGFADGRQLPEHPPDTPAKAASLARLLLDVGIGRLVTFRAATQELLRVALIAADTRKRGNRRRRTLEERLSALLDKAAKAAEIELGQPVEARNATGMPPSVSNRLQRVIYAANDRPLVAIATMFEAIGGGRQNEAFRRFVRVQDELDAVPVPLILVADGRGVRSVPLRIVEEVWERIGAVVSLHQADQGMLGDAVAELIRNPVAPKLSGALDTLIRGALERGVAADADDLPVGDEAARLAIARFEAEHPELDLVLDPGGRTVSVGRPESVSSAERLREKFDPADAIALAASLIARDIATQERLDGERVIGLLEVRPTALIPGQLVVTAQPSPATASDVRDVAEQARIRALETTVAILIVPDAGSWLADPDRELTTRTTATSVVVVDPGDLRTLAGAAEPQDALAALMLRQADLTKASPFIHNGVTPPRLFRGRRVDETSIESDLASSSVAVLGSRKIGKTSLLRRVEQTLKAQQRTVYYGDCQTIGDWTGFRRLVHRQWKVDLAAEFEPDQVAALIEALRVEDDPPVLILDEIDRLVAWDRAHEVGGVTEAFFRAMRAASQANTAQFVFSGERTIADVLWSPDSPHWNFCQRLSLRQLDRDAAGELLFGVLESLSIRFEDQAAAESELWRATSGHPRLVQLLGDGLVRRLNERPGDERQTLAVADLLAVLTTFEFKSEYVDTYFGQATPLEKALSRLVVDGERSLEALQRHAVAQHEPLALRILELYGIIDIVADEVRLRAEFLPEALPVAGPPPAAP